MSQQLRPDFHRVIPIASAPDAMPLTQSADFAPSISDNTLLDQLGRPLRDLRISVTDRCNFRCGYCMPRDVFDKHHAFLPQTQLLTFEEITHVADAFVGLGVRKLRITGGEPLLRKDIETLIRRLANLRCADGTPPELALTTNGVLLTKKAKQLRKAGLQRLTISLDALDDVIFKRMSDTDLDVHAVLDGIAAAQAAGFASIKVNTVIQRGVNDHQILPIARHFYGTGVEVRFIEFMDVGNTNLWEMDRVLTAEQIRNVLHTEMPLHPLPRNTHSTAQRWAYTDGGGQVGFIASVTQPFCGDCSRMRLSTDGKLFTCLFAGQGYDLRRAIRDEQLAIDPLRQKIAAVWLQRQDRYSEQRDVRGTPKVDTQPKVEMSFIGG
ncbi:MAG: GTP 3',8-cyclase MoaA [Aquabacterium sp.]|uniref:GTP 3',8-cyclase MoaA n=1 Tax=Aquabacterium sp. TaxID=1872578 RepID=UPI003BBCD6DE